MAHARNMALWLVAVIVLIAVFAMPSGAQAHSGHVHAGQGHAGQAHAGHAHAGPDRAIASVTPLPASVATAPMVRTRAETGLAHPCDGAGCRPGAACCTSPALAPDTQAALPARGPDAPAHARVRPARTDVVPEALPEPPRPFA